MTHETREPRMMDFDPGTDDPRIYVACLASYNSGMLHGIWVSAAKGADHIHEAVRSMYAVSPIDDAEEHAIHDYEGFEDARIEEYAGFEDVCLLAEFIAEHGELGGKLVAHFGGELEDAHKAMENYAGEHKSLGDFAAHLTEETGTPIPDNLRHYIDYDAMGRDMELSGDVFTIETGFEQVHIFWAH